MKLVAPCLGSLPAIALAAATGAVSHLTAREQPATVEFAAVPPHMPAPPSGDGAYRLAKDVSFNCIYMGLDADGRRRYAIGPTLPFWPAACPAAEALCEKMGLEDCERYGLFRRG
jgi:hypothetical protein